MGRARTATAWGLLVTGTVVVLMWTWIEARRQRREVVDVLTAQATVLAEALGPGLSAAATALSELDEIVTSRLLDNARLLAELERTGASPELILDLVELNNLEAVAFLGDDGRVSLAFGEHLPPAPFPELAEVFEGQSDELILGSVIGDDGEHLRVALRRPEGGAVLVQVDPSAARTFAGRLGVDNLLQRLVANESVLFLRYLEEPGGMNVVATWDGGELPATGPGRETLRTIRGRSAFEIEVPVEAAAGRRATLLVGLDGAPLGRVAAATMRRSLLVGVVLAGLAVALAAVVAVSSMRQRERREAALRLADAETARRRSERLAAAGALTAGLAHEVRSPLNAIGLAAQRLERKLEATDERRALATTVREEVRRLEDVLREFLELAKPVSQSFTEVDAGAIASEVVELLAVEAEAARVGLELLPGSGRVLGDSGALKRSLINLVRNAVEATPPGGRVVVFTEAGRESVAVRVRDDGPGVDAELAERVFDAFVSGKSSGTGLGLALVKRVAEEHGGSVALENRSGGGADAVLRLPAARRKERVEK
jgi:signal transduction histidine kinase